MRNLIKSRGFSYLEILTVIVIVSILVKMALFTYQDNIQETRRISMQLQIMDLRERIMQKQQMNNTMSDYEAASSIVWEASNPYYTLSFYPSRLASDNKTYGGMDTAIVATPIAGTSQANDGVICITKSGYRYWEDGAKKCKFANNGDNYEANVYKTMDEVRGSTWYGD